MDSRHGGEAASYYGEQSNPQYSHDGYGDRYDERQHHPTYPGPGPQNAAPGEDGERGLMGGLAGAAAGAYGGHKMGHGVIGAIGGAVAGHKLQDYVHDRKERKEEEERLQHQLHSGPPPPSYSPGPQYSSQPHHGGHHSPNHDRSIGSRTGNFSSSSDNIHLEGNYELHASCRRRDGHHQTSSLNLNKILSNENGRFSWARGGSGVGSITVQHGDTLADIARRFGCRVDEMVRINGLNNPDMIYPGQNLQVPGQPTGNFGSTARDVRLVDNGRVLEAELMDLGGTWHRQRLDLDEYIGNEDGHLRLV
ncbi:carbohydrate-binding module family 50 protein [Annulohypoxylon maeteangense]|uniref:carbohydrate-binding module family 50 protein n=1 Tax=Annulohypoxylon maeteangense TaxID=1927788 RepID=UPI0020086F96|nr:carbohydrate-binding module family 50 protein [Annulohypoxylon maeteangense]KAI0888525.1 carbohydrate-binding module family 50 protein [Annulohypoxylon maeteangense]